MSVVSTVSDENTAQTQPPEPEPVLLKAPRGIWLDALLFFVTFGFYAVFWLPARVGELKRARQGDFTPWAWIFVPVFWIAQLIALPRFLKAWTDWGEGHGVRTAPIKSPIAIGLIVLSNLFFLFSDNLEGKIGIELPYYTLLIAWLTLTLGYTLIAQIVREVVNGLPPEHYQTKRHRSGFGGLEWVIVILLTPFTALVIYGLLINTAATISGNALPAGHVYVDKQAKFTLTFAGDNWRIVPAGTFGDADSAAEFQGPLNDQTLIVYSYPTGQESLDSLVQWRLEHWVKNGFECQETRRWANETASPVSFTECSLSRLGDWQSIQLLSVIEHEEGFVELIGFLDSRPRVVQRYRSDFVQIAQSLEAI